MPTLHVLRERNGWVVKQALDETACMFVAQKTEALEIAQRWAERHPGCTILLYKQQGQPPQMILRRQRRRRRFVQAVPNGFSQNGHRGHPPH